MLNNVNYEKSLFGFSFELKNKQNIPGCGINAIKGCTFFIDKIDPIKFEVDDSPNLQTGKISFLYMHFCIFFIKLI